MASKKKRKPAAKARPPAIRKSARHLMPSSPKQNRGTGVAGLWNSWYHRMGIGGYDSHEWVRLSVLTTGLSIIAYFAFTAGGYFFVGDTFKGRGYGELLLLWLVVVGLLFELQVRGRMPRLGQLELGLFSGYVVWILLSVTWSISPNESFDEFLRGLLYVAGFGLFYLYLARKEWLGYLGHIFVIIAALVAIDALLGKTFPELVNHPDPFRSNRINYPITYWNTMAIFMNMGFIVGLRALADRATSLAVRAVYAPAMLLFLVVLWYTSSRAGILLLFLAFGLYTYLAHNRLRAVLQAGLLGAWTAAVVAISYIFLPNMVASVPDETLKISEGRQLALAILFFMAVGAGSQFVIRKLEGRVRISASAARTIGYGIAGAAAVFLVSVVLIFTSIGGRGGPVAFVRDQFSNTGETEQAVDRPSDRLFSLRTERIQEYSVSLKRFQDEPLTGTGAGTWSVAWLKYRPWDIQVKDGHSWLFETMAELGAVGTILLLSFIAMFFAASIRDLRFMKKGPDRELYGAFFTICTMFLLHSLIDWDWEMPVITLTFFMFAGGLLRFGMLVRREEQPEAVAETTRRDRSGIQRFAGWNWLLGAGCIVAMVMTLVTLYGNIRVRSASDQAGQQNYVGVERDARLAGRLIPLDAEPLVLQALAKQATGQIDQAAALMEEASRKEPENDAVLRNLVRIYLAMHDEAVARNDTAAQQEIIDKAHDALARARALNPLEPRETGALEIEFRNIGGHI